MENDPIPFHKPSIGRQDVEAIAATVESGWLTTGPTTREFEREFARTVNAQQAIAVSSGTAALHLALVAIGVGPGDEVIVPSMTFAATAEVVVHSGAVPVFVDVLPETLSIDPQRVAEALSGRTRAIIPVHYAGQAADMDALLELRDSSGVAIIEDAAHAYPASYRNRRIGTLGDVTCFSFYATKTITTGEGGMITCENEELAGVMRSLSLHGLSNNAWERNTPNAPWDYQITRAGFKYNMPDMAASLGLSQVRRAEAFRVRRSEIARRYSEHFAGQSAIAPLAVRDWDDHAWHLYVVRLCTSELKVDRNHVISELRDAGIGTSVHFRPLHMHPYYRDQPLPSGGLPMAESAFAEIISLPIFPDMSDQMVDRVASTLVDIVAVHRR